MPRCTDASRWEIDLKGERLEVDVRDQVSQLPRGQSALDEPCTESIEQVIIQLVSL